VIGAAAMTLLLAGASTPSEPFIAYIEWVLNVRLCVGERAEAARLVDEASRAPASDDQRLIARAIELEADRGTHAESELATLRSSVEDEYLKTLRGRYKASKVARWILGLKADATRAIAPGQPALTRHAAACAAELTTFAMTDLLAARGSLDPARRETFVRQLASVFPRLTSDEKAALVAVPEEWARVRSLWALADEERRRQLRATWAPLLVTDGSFDPKLMAEAAPTFVAHAPGWK
jgi:hypothetical protein